MKERWAARCGATVCLALLAATGMAAESAKAPIKIIAIGDSITEAYRVIPQAYRFHLAKMLDEKGIAYDFVGSKNGVLQNAGDGSVDLDHESYSGWRADQVIPPALKTARAEKPDIALIHLGTNDIVLNQGVDNAMSDAETLIQGLREANPRVVIFLALIPWKDNQLIEELNTRLKDYAEGAENIFHVEMRPFELNQYYRDFPRYSLHPNEAGAKRMAEVFFAAMDREILSAKPKKPAVTDVPDAKDREIRTWTSKKGGTVRGRLIKTTNGGSKAVLQTGKTKYVTIGVESLVDADQGYVKSLME